MTNGTARILIVDDNEMNRVVLRDFIVAMDYKPMLAEDGAEAIERLKKDPPDLMLLDIMMPNVDGFGVLSFMKRTPKLSSLPVIVISAVDQIDNVVRCIEAGADDYLSKPFNPTVLRARIKTSLQKHSLIRKNKELLEKTLGGSLKILMDVLSLVNPAAFGRASRLKRTVRLVAIQMHQTNVWELEVAAMLSQIGCITVPPEILGKVNRGEPLTSSEAKTYWEHPKIGHDLMANLPNFEAIAEYIRCQHMDLQSTSALKQTRKNEEIPYGAKLLRLALDYDGLVSSGQKPEWAIMALKKKAKKYDPEILSALEKVVQYDFQRKIRDVPFEELHSGMAFAEDVYDESGTLLLSRGQQISPAVRMRLVHMAKKMRIPQTYKVFTTR